MTTQRSKRGPIDLADVTRAVVWNQALWTAGYSLTTGGFLVYFGKELGSNPFQISLILVIPETVGLVGILSRWIIQKTGNRKHVWIGFSVLARCCSVGIPLLAFSHLRPEGINPLWIMISCLAAAEAANSIAYVAYLSWLTDLVGEHRWGRLFATRNIAKLCVLLVVPVAGGYLRDWWRKGVPPDVALLAYVVAFGIGLCLLFLSMIPLLRLPNIAIESAERRLPEWRQVIETFGNRSLRFLLIHNWWLAFANGLTQAAFFSYLFGPLSIQLGTLYVLLSLMRVVKIPVSIVTGTLCDHFGNKTILFWGILIVSGALPFWLLATKEQWTWVFGAYFVWGIFAAVNISGRNLVLKLSPRSDNSTQLALFRQVGGLLAGLSGLLGGMWLTHLLKSKFLIELGSYRFEGYQLLFLISFVGRVTAAFWILPIDEPGGKRLGWMLRALTRQRQLRSDNRQDTGERKV